MKKILLLLLLPMISFAQDRQIKGKIVNAAQHPIVGSTIVLMDSVYQVVEETKSDAEGIFKLSMHSHQLYFLSVEHIGYEVSEQSFVLEQIKDSLYIVLSEKSKTLDEVTVTRKRPVVTRKLDRLEFNVQHSNISSLNSWEILKKTPLVSIVGGNLSVKGNQAILVMINDKRVMLSGDELKMFLENTQGTDVQSIEVITNPPAKYEASGNTIINIKMKRNEQNGYRGVALAKVEQSNFGKQIFGLTNYYKTEKFNFRSTYNFGRGTYARYGQDYVYYPNENNTWISKMDRIDENKNQQTYIFSLDFTPDSTLSFTLGLDGFYSPNSNGVYVVPTNIYNAQQQIESHYTTTNDHRRAVNTNNLYLQITKKLNSNTSLDWANYLTTNKRSNFQDVWTVLNFKDKLPTNRQFINDNNTQTKLFSTQIDLSTKRDRLSYEYGGKYSYVSTRNILDFWDNELGELQNRPEKSSMFDYWEHNAALYGSLSFDWKKWSWKAGLRAEYTNLNGNVSEPKMNNSDSYLVLFPTYYMQYETADQTQLGFSYGKRISRPSYSWLNPAKSYYNLFSYFQGDPTLRATIVHNLNLTYTKNNWNVDLFYRFEKWPSMEISLQQNETNTLIYYYTNIKKGQGTGVDVSKNLDINSWWSLNAMFTALYNENYFQGVDNNMYKNNVYSFNSNLSSSVILDKKNDWNVELGHQYYTPSIQGPFRISSFSSTYLVMNRKFFNKKLEANFYFMDIFKTEAVTVSSKYADQDNYFWDYQDTRKVGLTLRYNFGNQGIKNNKLKKRIDEQDRI